MVRMIEFQIYSFVHVTINLKISIIFGVALKKSNASVNERFQLPMTFYLIVSSVQFYSVEIL